MTNPTIQFTDGAAYERYMGRWSHLVGAQFLDWLAPRSGVRWLDVGCGNGAFTEMLVERCAPVALHGIDPSEAQLAFARTRPALHGAQFRLGDAMALPFAENDFDAAVMPLVIFFLTDPARGVAEMARVVSSGGIVAAYAWDMIGGGFPYETPHQELRAMGIVVPTAPTPDASRIEVMQRLWTDAGLSDIETRIITVERTFTDFVEYWSIVGGSPSVGSILAAMPESDLAPLKQRMQARLPTDAAGRICLSARAHAVRGRVR